MVEGEAREMGVDGVGGGGCLPEMLAVDWTGRSLGLFELLGGSCREHFNRGRCIQEPEQTINVGFRSEIMILEMSSIAPVYSKRNLYLQSYLDAFIREHADSTPIPRSSYTQKLYKKTLYISNPSSGPAQCSLSITSI